jgi:hypothetical protein
LHPPEKYSANLPTRMVAAVSAATAVIGLGTAEKGLLQAEPG